MENEDGVVRGCVASYLSQLTDRDLVVMLPDIIKAIEEMAPSNEMLADGIRPAGLDLLSRLHIREGMDLCVSTIELRWGNDVQKRLEYLKRYGVHAKEVLPQLRTRARRNGRTGEDVRQVHRRNRGEQGFAAAGGSEGFYRSCVHKWGCFKRQEH